jgi:serine protease AprX
MGVVWRGPARVALVAALGVVGLSAAAVPPAQSAEKKPPKQAAVAGTVWGDKKADRVALDLYDRNDAKQDPGSLFTITNAIGAREVWRDKDAAGRAVTGQGVTVAVLDSGVAAVPGLDAPGKVVRGPDLSLEANSDAVLSDDTYGHGTHLAGIIAGRDPVPTDPKSGAPKADDASKQLGVAPDAQLLALKLASTDGSTDVSQVIAALDWVAQHRSDQGLNVRVVNLSFGTNSVQPYQVDPLAAAAENAWRAGLVVVVSGGNGGPDAGGLTNPAIDPYVIAVGSSDPNNKVTGWDHPRVAAYSSRGTEERHVDLLAPGRSVVGLRDPGSYVDVNNPEGLVKGDPDARLFRGSGTSQAAAVVSGAAALLLQAFPQLTPDQVKAMLVSTAKEVHDGNVLDAGAGQLDVHAAIEAAKKTTGAKDAAARLATAAQPYPAATGTGSLEEARGGAELVDPETGEILAGEVDVQGLPWDAPAWAAESAAGRSWTGGVWNRARWSGDTWTSSGWARARWSGSGWSRARWSDVDWDRARWSGARWSRARWSDDDWQRARWSGNAWS